MKTSKDMVDKLHALGLLKVSSIAELANVASRNGRDVLEEAIVAGLISQDALPYLLSENLDIPFTELNKEDVDSSLSSILPSEVAWGEEVIPISLGAEFITVGVSNPLRPRLYRRVEILTGKKVRVVLVSENSIKEILIYLYPPPLDLSREKPQGELSRDIDITRYLAVKDSSSLVSEILYLARIAGYRVLTFHHIFGRFIIDGKRDNEGTVLLEASLDVGEFIFTGLKKLCGFSEKGASIQEYIIETGKENRSGMYKVALVLGSGSHKSVIRVIPNALGKLSIDDLGFDDEQLSSITRIIEREKGIYIVASPHYDGVTTTLYSMVRNAQKPDSRVVAIEEDIRYKNEGFIQIEKRMTGDTFFIDKTIRTLTPDILMLDNLSLEDLVEEAVPITPSPVSIFAGVQCDDLESVLERLLHAYTSPYALASALKAVVFQKLVKILCKVCKKELPTIPSMFLSREMVESGEDRVLRNLKYYVPTGCEVCAGTGYSGKTALFDVIIFSPSLRMEIFRDIGIDQKIENILSHQRQGPEDTVLHMLIEGEITFEEGMPFLKRVMKRNVRG